jgi:hypothetical protein
MNESTRESFLTLFWAISIMFLALADRIIMSSFFIRLLVSVIHKLSPLADIFSWVSVPTVDDTFYS